MTDERELDVMGLDHLYVMVADLGRSGHFTMA